MAELLEELSEQMFPRVLPPGWRRAHHPADAGNKFYTGDGMTIVASAERIAGERWWHVSCARPARLPSWEDVKRVKDVFFGRRVLAVQVLPGEDVYVNDHPFCLHLWRNLDREIVPDLRREGTL